MVRLKRKNFKKLLKEKLEKAIWYFLVIGIILAMGMSINGQAGKKGNWKTKMMGVIKILLIIIVISVLSFYLWRRGI